MENSIDNRERRNSMELELIENFDNFDFERHS